ncbi:MAG: methyltransferase domain-containing protein, partial [Clostridiales bacterium]|nr:methyltransferase domain-containing protein [Clostridiales bacterium]
MEHLRQIKGSLDRTRAVYEEVFTREQDRITGEGLWLERLTTLHVLGQELQPSSSVLDLGCGTGVYALPLAQAGHQVRAVDLVPHHIEQLKEQAG